MQAVEQVQCNEPVTEILAYLYVYSGSGEDCVTEGGIANGNFVQVQFVPDCFTLYGPFFYAVALAYVYWPGGGEALGPDDSQQVIID